jgi:hypothetical protein
VINVSLDIDGTISDYPFHWLEYIKVKTGLNFLTVNDAKKTLGLAKYNQVKDLYRQSEDKYSIPIRNQLRVLATDVYKMGGKVFINSRRPFNDYPSMLNLTREWLTSNNLPFESIQAKSEFNLLSQKIMYHFDDEMSECNRLHKVISIKKIFLISPTCEVSNFDHKIIEINPYFSVDSLIGYMINNA